VNRRRMMLCGVCAGALLLALLLWNPLLDALPVDQSRWKQTNGAFTYLDAKGDRVTGWQVLDGRTYYFAPDTGIMHTGWLELDGQRYYLGSDGILRTGWLELEGNRYYLHPDGAMHIGWLDEGGHRYYLDPAGALQTGWFESEGSRYYAAASGAVHTGWLEEGSARYYLSRSGMHTGWLDWEGKLYYLNDAGIMQTGWMEWENRRVYLGEDGILATGWREIDGGRYYFDNAGTMQTGWLETESGKYYLKEDGTAAQGHLVLDGQDYYFTSTGANIILVNRWNPIPKDYTTELVNATRSVQVAAICYDSLQKMLEDCRQAGFPPKVYVGYRSYSTQSGLFQSRLKYYMSRGLSYGSAYSQVRKIVAIPGTSEHQLGLAVDLMDQRYYSQDLSEDHALYWLAEHCWEYGWILRYPEDKSDITGIIYEPWHFRYVGVDLAMELKESGLCLEEYLDALTNDGTTCGDPDA